MKTETSNYIEKAYALLERAAELLDDAEKAHKADQMQHSNPSKWLALNSDLAAMVREAEAAFESVTHWLMSEDGDEADRRYAGLDSRVWSIMTARQKQEAMDDVKERTAQANRCRDGQHKFEGRLLRVGVDTARACGHCGEVVTIREAQRQAVLRRESLAAKPADAPDSDDLRDAMVRFENARSLEDER